MEQKIDLEQLREDMDTLSASELAIKYPHLSIQALKGLSVEELEKRISKQSSGMMPNKRNF